MRDDSFPIVLIICSTIVIVAVIFSYSFYNIATYKFEELTQKSQEKLK